MHRGLRKPNEQIVIMTISEPFDIEREPLEIVSEAYTMLGGITEPFFLIYDAPRLPLSPNDLVNAWADYRFSHGEGREFDKYGRMIVVSNDEVARLGARIGQHLYPGKDIRTFDTVEEAVDYARAALAKR